LIILAGLCSVESLCYDCDKCMCNCDSSYTSLTCFILFIASHLGAVVGVQVPIRTSAIPTDPIPAATTLLILQKACTCGNNIAVLRLL